MTTKRIDRDQLLRRIAELEATPRALVGSDEGTHGTPLNHRIYEEITGERYATVSFAGSNASRCTEESAYEDTEGRILIFHRETSRIRGLQRELAALKKQLRQITR